VEKIGFKILFILSVPHRVTSELRPRRIELAGYLLRVLDKQQRAGFSDIVTGDESWRRQQIIIGKYGLYRPTMSLSKYLEVGSYQSCVENFCLPNPSPIYPDSQQKINYVFEGGVDHRTGCPTCSRSTGCREK
jgi:hypothetical protein